MGDGAVIAIMADADFRGFWYGSAQLFLNAVFLPPYSASCWSKAEPMKRTKTNPAWQMLAMSAVT